MKLNMNRWRRTKARTTDPITSHEAVAPKTEATLNEQQQAVMRVLLASGGRACDRDLVFLYRHHRDRGRLDLPPQTESGIRTRRNELVKSGKIADLGLKVTLDTGRKAIVWHAVEA